tara:strand:+ start:13270 stop:13698 length:429 start_codon:yes stop_codon:yes gene_type:complete
MYTQHAISEAEHKAWFARCRQDENKHLLLAQRGDEPFGFVNILVEDPKTLRAKWGFYLAPDASRGSGRALGMAALSHAFGSLGLHKLWGEALAYNTRSISFHERLGFIQEARFRDHHFDGEKYHDVIGFGLLKSEWRSPNGA